MSRKLERRKPRGHADASRSPLSLIIGKLSSQTLLFGLAMALVAVSYASINSAQTHRPMLTFLLLIFAMTLTAYLGIERRTPGRGKRNRERDLSAGALTAECAVPRAVARSGGELTAQLVPSSWGPGAVALVRGVHAA